MKSLLAGALALLFVSCSPPTLDYITPPNQITPRAPSLSVTGQDLTPIAAKIGGQVIGVYGWSMFPTIPPFSVVVVEPYPYNQLRAGDVVVYLDGNGRSVCHRLIKRSGEGWVAKGDNNPEVDKETVEGWNYMGLVRVVGLP